jgi:hypothetical protein
MMTMTTISSMSVNPRTLAHNEGAGSRRVERSDEGLGDAGGWGATTPSARASGVPLEPAAILGA